MSTLLDKPHMPPGSVTDARRPNIIFTRILTAPRSTTTSKEILDQNLTAASEMTTSGIAVASTSSPEATQKALSELRRLSGLTWEQLAKLFNVSRRSLHFWASGQPLSRFNEEHLNRLLGTIRYIDRGSASLNRSLLLRPGSNGNPLFDLLVAGKYEEFKRVVGAGNAPQKVELGALSEEERRMRMPLPPDVLANPLSDVSYRQTGKAKPARAARSRKNSSGQ
jgi:transcriptional regulator with XRE-family HTH domain